MRLHREVGVLGLELPEHALHRGDLALELDDALGEIAGIGRGHGLHGLREGNADIMADPHYAARGMIEQHTVHDGKGVKLPGIVPKLSATPGRTRWLGPRLGQHTDEVLAELGYDGARCAALRTKGVIR